MKRVFKAAVFTLCAAAFASLVLMGCSESGGTPYEFTGKKQYNVSFLANGGFPTPKSIIVDSGSVLGAKLPDTSKIKQGNLFFAGWFDTTTVPPTRYYHNTPITKNLWLKAAWRDSSEYKLAVSIFPENAGSVSFDPELGVGDSVYKAGAQVVVTAEPAPGYTFAGWSGASKSSERTILVSMDSSMALTATFELVLPTTYELATSVFPAGGGKITRNPDQTAYIANAMVVLTAEAAAGYVFVGWASDDKSYWSSDPSQTITMNGNRTITANFQQSDLILAAGEAWVSGGPTGDRTGYIFRSNGLFSYINDKGSWQIDFESTWAADDGVLTLKGDEQVDYDVANGKLTMTNSKGLTTVYTKTSGILIKGLVLTTDVKIDEETAANFGAVTLNPPPPAAGYSSGTKVTATATATAGYVFIGWSGASSSITLSTDVTMDGNQMLTAHFRKAETSCQLTVLVPTGGGNVVLQGTDTQAHGTSHAPGTMVNVGARATWGYEFVGWSGASTSTEVDISVTMSTSRTLIANFKKLDMHKLIINSFNGGSVLVNGNINIDAAGGAIEFPPKALVTVTARPDAEYDFAGWSGASTSKEETLSFGEMNSDVQLTANFVTATLKTVASPTSGGKISIGGGITRYKPSGNNTATVTAVPEFGYRFDGWTGVPTGAEMNNPVTVPMSDDVTVTALFVKDAYKLTLVASAENGSGSGSYAGNRILPYRLFDRARDWDSTNNALHSGLTGRLETITKIDPFTKDSISTDSIIRVDLAKDYLNGTNVDIMAVVASSGDYEFVGWSGTMGTSNDSELTVPMNQDHEITAHFRSVVTAQYNLSTKAIGANATLTFTSDSARTAQPSVNGFDVGRYSSGAAVTVTAPEVTGYRFVGWSGASTSINRIINVTITKDLELIATYEQD